MVQISCQIQPSYSVAPSKVKTIVQISQPLSPTAISSTSAISPRFLAATEDKSVPNRVHSFVRKNDEIYAATETNITDPALVTCLGQVGIMRTIHFSKIP